MPTARSSRSTMPSLSTRKSSTKFLAGFGNGRFPTGPILRKRKRVRSISTTGGAVSISRIRTGTSWKSSLALTAAAAGIHDAEVSLAAMETFPQLSPNLKWECSRDEPSPPVDFAGSRTCILVRNSAPAYRWIWVHPTRICEVSARSGRLHRRASRNGIALILFAGLADDHCRTRGRTYDPCRSSDSFGSASYDDGTVCRDHHGAPAKRI